MFGLTFFGPAGLKMFMGTQETNIYRLVVRNPSYYAYFPFLIFGPLLVGNGRGHHACPSWSRASKPDQKIVPQQKVAPQHLSAYPRILSRPHPTSTPTELSDPLAPRTASEAPEHTTNISDDIQNEDGVMVGTIDITKPVFGVRTYICYFYLSQPDFVNF